MIDSHQLCQIQDLQDTHRLKVAQIAEALSLDPRTVASWLRQERFRPRQSTPRASTLDPCKPQIVQMLEKYPSSAAQVWQRLREQGFEGGYSIVKASVHTIRPTRQPAFLTLAFAPGECAQVDWGSFGSVPVEQTSRRLSFFVMVLCYSRLMSVAKKLGTDHVFDLQEIHNRAAGLRVGHNACAARGYRAWSNVNHRSNLESLAKRLYHVWTNVLTASILQQVPHGIVA